MRRAHMRCAELSFFVAALAAVAARAEDAVGPTAAPSPDQLVLQCAADAQTAEPEDAARWSSALEAALAGPERQLAEQESAAATLDSHIEAVQLQTPALQAGRQPVRVAQTSRTSSRSSSSGLASVPYMIGDTGGGSCIGFRGFLNADLSHPTLACSRLNVSEANSPRPTDRFYYSYRHFENVTDVSAFQFRETLNVEQHTIAWENTFWDRTGSLEIRVPIEQRLRSDVFSIITPDFGVVDPLVAPRDGREVELANVSLVFKMLMIEREEFLLSGGVGVTLPTARDVNYQLAVAGEFELADLPGFSVDEAAAFQTVFANETVYIAPFLAWAYAPQQSRWFHQGFLQVETAANPSRVTFIGDGSRLYLQNGVPVGFYDYFTPVPVRAELFSQTLLRLNMGWGYSFYEGDSSSWLDRLTGLFEVHYTTTVEDAKPTELPLTQQANFGTVPLQNVTVGAQDNRVDILNAAAGFSAEFGQWLLTNGVVAPIRGCPDCAFDFEYNVQVQRRF